MEVRVPDLGDFADVEVIEILVKPGDSVALEDALITLETEKAAMDVPSPAAGTIREIKVSTGSTVSTGDVIALLDADAEEAADEDTRPEEDRTVRQPRPPAADTRPEEDRTVRQPRPRKPGSADAGMRERGAAHAAAPSRPIDEAGFSRAHASPSVRKLARELGVDLPQVEGTGRKGRVTADDVKAFVKGVMRGGAMRGPALPEVPRVDHSQFGPVEERALSRIQKISGPRLHASWVNVPHVTQHDEADITELEEMRRSLKDKAAERGIKLTPLAFVMRACSLTLGEFPDFRSSLAGDGEHLVLKHYTHLGFAADTPNGLVVPVIRDADKKDVYELAEALGEMSARAREGKLKIDEMQGGVFTISSLGGIGGTFFTPIVNAPEVAILGVSRNYMKPVWQDGEFVPRLTLPLSLSYDHRVIDGAQAVRFTTRLCEVLGQVERLVEAIP